MTDPVSRLGEIKARRDGEFYVGHGAQCNQARADVGWLLEHIEQQADLIAEFRLRDESASCTIAQLREALHDARRTAALGGGDD